jgi:hypothetical protein
LYTKWSQKRNIGREGKNGRQGEGEKGRRGERETGRRGEREKGRTGDRETLHPSSFTLHPSSFILHPSSFILPPLASFATRRSRLLDISLLRSTPMVFERDLVRVTSNAIDDRHDSNSP